MAGNFERSDDETLDSSQSQRMPDLLGVALRRKSLLALGLMAGLVLGGLYFGQCQPVYESAAQVLVVKKQQQALPIQALEAQVYPYEDYLATHMVLIKSPLIIGEAVRKHGLNSLPSFAGMGNPVGSIIGSLSVTRAPSKDPGSLTTVVCLTFRGKVAEDCAAVLNAVTGSYEDFLGATYRNVSGEALSLITQARDVLQKDLKEKEVAYQEFLAKAPLAWKAEGETNIHRQRLAQIESARSNLLLSRAQAEGRLNLLDTLSKDGDNRQALSLIVSLLSGGDPDAKNGQSSPQFLEDKLLPLLLQQKKLLQDYGSDHPQVRTLRDQIKFTIDFYEGQSTAWKEAVEDTAVTERPRFMDRRELYTEFLKHDLEGSREVERQLTELFDHERKASEMLGDYESQDRAFRDDIARTQGLYETILKRLQEIVLFKDQGGFDAQVIHPPGRGWQIAPSAMRIFSMAAFFGILGGFGLAYMAEIADKSFRTPEEIRRRLGLPVVGHIPFFEPEDATLQLIGSDQIALGPMLRAHHFPKSPAAEAYRGVRTALYFSTQGEGHKVIQITSPSPGDGKSTLASNLSVSIAQSGKKILLIDCDFRKPQQHKTFALEAKAGLASVIADEAELVDAIQATQVSGLSVLPCGPHPPNPADLLTSPRFKDILDLVREQYDFVVLDTPPLLAVTDPCVVAARVDGVLLTVRMTKNGRPDAERAKDVLDTLGAKVLGVVVNGLGHRNGYGYGGYSYGSRYYTYNYGYGSYYDSDGDKSRGSERFRTHDTEERDDREQSDSGSYITSEGSDADDEGAKPSRRNARTKSATQKSRQGWLGWLRGLGP